MKNNSYEEMVVRYMGGKPGVNYKDGKLIMDNVSDRAEISFEGNNIIIDLTSLHPKKTTGREVITPKTYDEAMDAVNGVYAQIYPIEM